MRAKNEYKLSLSAIVPSLLLCFFLTVGSSVITSTTISIMCVNVHINIVYVHINIMYVHFCVCVITLRRVYSKGIDICPFKSLSVNKYIYTLRIYIFIHRI